MYSFPNLEPVCCSMSSTYCCFLTCIQVSQEAGKVVWYSYLFKNFPQFVVIHTVKSFSIVNEAEADVFLEFSCFFYDPMDVGNLISGSSASSKSILNIWRFLVHVLLKPILQDFEHYLASTWNVYLCILDPKNWKPCRLSPSMKSNSFWTLNVTFSFNKSHSPFPYLIIPSFSSKYCPPPLSSTLSLNWGRKTSAFFRNKNVFLVSSFYQVSSHVSSDLVHL